MTTVSPTLEQLKKEGEQGRKMINQYTRYLTVVLAAFQAYGIAVGLEGAATVVADPGLFFRISTVITLTGGTMFLMWLGEQITAARHRQRHLAHHHVGHRRATAFGHRRHARTRPPGRAVDRAHPRGAGDGGGGDHLHRVHGARAAAAVDPVSEAPGRQPHVRGPVLASAAQAQYVGRHSADLRLFAAAVADDGRQLHRRAGAGLAHHRSPRSSRTGGRCFSRSMSA